MLKKSAQTFGMFYNFFFDCSFFLPVMIFGLQQNTATAEKEAVLRVDGTEIQNIPFDGWRKELHIYLQR